jgi:glycosyltransferase involved in cell wall biosynthesis
MKLLFISQYFPPETGAGSARADAMVKYLGRLGWEIDVICEIPNYPTGVTPKKYNGLYHITENRHQAKVHRVWVWANPRQSLVQQLGIFGTFLSSSIIFALKNPKNYDAVYATSPPIFVGIAGVIISKMLKTRFVIEVRDIWPDAASDEGHIDESSFFYKMGRKIESWIYKNADLIIPVTHRSEEIILQRVNHNQSCVIHNGVDLERFKVTSHHSDKKENKFRVGYVGSLGVAHDLETVVKAAKLLESDPEIEFVLVGDGRNHEKLTKFLDEYKPNNLDWLGEKPHDEIPGYISGFDVGLNPIYDSEIYQTVISVKFFEYLACGIPVISMARGLQKDIGDKSGAAVTVEPENAEKLADAIRELKNDREKLRVMSANARPFVQQQFSREVMAEKLSDRLKELIK